MKKARQINLNLQRERERELEALMKKQLSKREEKPTKDPSYVVGIGASAGGFEAFSKLLEHLAPDTGMVFVFVQHLAPTHESVLPQLLKKKTTMPIHQVKDNMHIVPNHIYVIPPNTSMTIIDGTLKLAPRIQGEKGYHPIDSFFTSLASVHQGNAIGIVLSGTATDGTLGLKSIKAEGGITLAQDDTATHQDMPRSAIEAGVVDSVLSPEQIAKELGRISKHPYAGVASQSEKFPETGDALRKILYLLRLSCGVDFTHYKQTTIKRRIMRRMLLARFKKLEDYTQFLRENKNEADALYQDLLINVTSFFRDEKVFKALAQTVFPTILKNRKPNDAIRIWVPGCATGEEAYSIAIVLFEVLGEKRVTVPIQIFATDLNEQAIVKARAGIYPKSAFANVTSLRLKNFFSKIDGHYQINKSIRELCVFSPHNFITDPPFSRLDLISCQNVLIYLEPVLQQKAQHAFHYGLKSSGFLQLGKSETVSSTPDAFTQVDKELKLYTKKGVTSRLPLDVTMHTLTEKVDSAQMEDTVLDGKHEIDIDREADQLLLSRFVPASVVINSDLEILRFRGATAMYLEPTAGKASLNLLKMVRSELVFELRSLIYKAKKEGRSTKKEGIHIPYNGNTHKLSLEVVPMKSTSEPHFVILFTDTTTPVAIEEKITLKGKQDDKDKRIGELEQELSLRAEQIKSIGEEFEATNEEFQSANEEVLSSNEELQSINEELETSKEELQSTNEELTTINDELQNRNVELKEGREYVEGIVATVREPLIVLNQDLRVRTANASFYKVFQVSPEATEGCLIYELGGNQWNIPALRTLLSEILPKSNVLHDYEVEHTFPSIGRKIMLLNARKLVLEGNMGAMILLAIEDITDRKKGERTVQESGERLRFMAETMPQKIFTATPTGEVDYFNPQWMEFTGLTFEKIRDWGWTQFIHPDDVKETVRRWKQSIATGEPFDIEHRFRRFDDVYHWHLSRALPMKDEKGKTMMWVGSNTDIHEQKKSEEQLKESQRQRDEFIGIASHELKTPVTSVKAYTQILQSRFIKAEDMKSAEMVGKMDGQLDKLTNLIADLLDVTKIEGGKLQFHESYFDFNELTSEIIDELQRTTDKHTIIKELAKTRTVYGDRDRIGQVITNFITNAIKYSPHTDRVIVTSTFGKENVTMSVQDFGVGLSQIDQAKVFERFYRVSGADQDTYPGLGLGLFISAEVIKRQKGKIWVESKKDKGSTFYFSLPIQKRKIKQQKNTAVEEEMKHG